MLWYKIPWHHTKHWVKHCLSNAQSIAGINKQLNLKLINLKTLDIKPFLKNDKSEIPENYLGSYQWALKFQELFLKNLKNKPVF